MFSRAVPVLTITLLPVLVMVLGSVIAAYRVPGPSWRSALQHFAAGVVLAAVAGELLPEITHGRDLAAVVLGFILGVLVMLLVRHFAEGEKDPAHEQRTATRPGIPRSLVFAIGVDVFIDGLLIGVGYAAGAHVGQLLALALTIELLFLALSSMSALRGAGVARSRAVGTMVALALAVVLGASLGAVAFSGLRGFALVTVLSFGAAALLYLVTEELLVKAHEVRETPWITSAFFAGFLLLYLVELLT